MIEWVMRSWMAVDQRIVKQTTMAASAGNIPLRVGSLLWHRQIVDAAKPN